MKAIRGYGYESITVHVVFEVFTPFIVFLAAEHFGTSGILAVVAAGLLITLLPQKPTPVAARLKIASNSVWETLVFVINGVVFVMLGMQLPKAIMPSWRSDEVSSLLLCGLVLLVTALVVGVRFIWVLVMERCDSSAKRRTGKQLVRDALVTTLSGPKRRHAVHYHDHPVHAVHRRGVPAARHAHLPGVRRHFVHVAAGELRGAGAGAEGGFA